MRVDPAILKLLQLDANSTSVSSAGGGGCSSASTSKIVSKLSNGEENAFFMKTGTGSSAEIMFEGEHMSLNAINAAVPSLCPRSFGHGRFKSDPKTSFLITDFLHLTSRRSSKAPGPSLAQKLAKLHTTPAPVPDGYDKPMFGFPVTTCCGDTAQNNSYKETWADFYADNRLRFILREGEKNQGNDKEFHNLVETTVSKVVPRLIGNDHLNNGRGVIPVVVHGDLWSGNTSVGIIGDRKGEPEDVVFDSSACYPHSEFELGIMKMFGGFGASFLEEYHELCPKTEPVGEYEDRVKLYELYHHLNHWAMFGGGYKSGAASIMRSLVLKYGES